jgi:hypothetical protein
MSRIVIGMLAFALLAGCGPRPMPLNVIPPNMEARADTPHAKPIPARN